MAFTAAWDPGDGALRLAGECRMADAPVLTEALERLEGSAPRAVSVELAQAGEFDIGPSWLLYRALESLRGGGVELRIDGAVPEHFEYFGQLLAREPAGPAAAAALPLHFAALNRLGHSVTERLGTWYEALTFGGITLLAAATSWTSLRRLRLPSVVRHVYETGVQAVPVVAVIALLMAIITAYIGAQQLKPFGGEIFTVDLVAIGVLREMGVLLTAIMVAGRTGSAYAAEIGVMKLNDEVDALESMGVNPYEVLVLPRVLGLVIALPLLTIVADAMGLVGGAILTRMLLDLPWPQFFMRLDAAIADTTFWAGLIKAPFFAVLIALTGTLRGLQVRESSRELGRLTTVAVVQSIFLVIFADALFAVFYLHIDF